MKKKAFTVAEILITLGIIGVISALTLPMLSQSTQKKVFANGLAAAVSDLENATTSMLLQEGAYMLQDTPAWKSNFLTNFNKIFHCNTEKEVGTTARLTLKSAAGAAFAGTYKFFSNNGVLYGITIYTDKTRKKESEVMAAGGDIISLAAEVYIDVNGPKKPNMWGRDTFRYVLSSDGHLYPYGGKAWSVYYGTAYDSKTTKQECVTNHNGTYCAAYLAENGYDMDY